jgi:hypothetical protein
MISMISLSLRKKKNNVEKNGKMFEKKIIITYRHTVHTNT